MATTIPAVQDTDNIYPVTLIDLDLNGNVYYLSDSYKSFTVGGNDYNELGAFLSITDVDDNLKTTQADISLALSGIPSSSTGSEVNYLRIILEQPIKGGNITISRAFMNSATQELDTGNVYTRYKGVITNYSIEERFNYLNKENDYAVTVIASSITALLENRVAGQRTDPVDRKRLYPADKSFDRIPDIHNSPFDFGKEYDGGSYYGGGGYGGGCLHETTLITMADGTLKQIRDIQFGDKVLSYDHETGKTVEDTVLAIHNPLADHLVHIEFDGKQLKLTEDHPVYIEGKGYCSHNPQKTAEIYGLEVKKYQEKDKIILLQDGEQQIIEIDTIIVKHYQNVQTYNLKHIDIHNNYFANGVLVHNKYRNTPGYGGRTQEK